MSTILFTSDLPGFYPIGKIYHPDTNPEGQIIPRPDSLVLDPANGSLQRVVSVNETTHISTYGPVLTQLLKPEVVTEDISDVSIIDYGNSRFYLFYDKSENPTKLNVDKKVLILGNDAELFEIVKWNQDTQEYSPVSLYYDIDGVYRGTKIPLVTVTDANNVKVPTNCHTSIDIQDGEIYYLLIYDYAGTQCGSVKLFANRAIVNNVYEDALVIEDMNIIGTQQDGQGLYLFPDQDPLSLVISAKLTFSDGTDQSIPIDNELCHLYGLEGFTAAYPGQEVDMMVKYFLAPLQQAVGPKVGTSGSSRYMVDTMKLRVKDPGTNDYVVKILTVPRYIHSTNRWVLTHYLYTIGENEVRNITSKVNISPPFDGMLMGTDQQLTMELRIRDVWPDAESDFHYQQPIVIKVNPSSWVERYIMRDSLGDTYGVYGVDSPILPRPVLYYDPDEEKYFIPTSKFGNKNKLLEAFYYKARPLYDSSWLTEPIEPTHFTIRDSVSGSILLSSPIAVDSYAQSFGLVGVDQPDQLVGVNCVVEWLKFVSGQFMTLYGAPVDVYNQP